MFYTIKTCSSGPQKKSHLIIYLFRHIFLLFFILIFWGVYLLSCLLVLTRFWDGWQFFFISYVLSFSSLQMLPYIGIFCTKWVKCFVEDGFLLILFRQNLRIGRIINTWQVSKMHVVDSISGHSLIKHTIRITGIFIWAIVHIAHLVLHQFLILIYSLKSEWVWRN